MLLCVTDHKQWPNEKSINQRRNDPNPAAHDGKSDDIYQTLSKYNKLFIVFVKERKKETERENISYLNSLLKVTLYEF